MDIWAYVLIGLVAWVVFFSIYGIHLTRKDKRAANNNKWRVKEITLIIVSMLGGSVAMYATMLKSRHKTNHKKFMLGIPAIILLQAVLIITIALLYFLVWR